MIILSSARLRIFFILEHRLPVFRAKSRQISEQKLLSNDEFSADYCMNLVAKNDHENFLCTLLLDASSKRRHAFAIRAFNVEVAKIGSTVSEEQIGRIKLKFWYDSIDKCFDDENSYVLDHPVLKELKHVANNNKLTKTYLKRLVTARDRSPNQQFITVKQLEDYAEQSFSSVYYLLAELYDVKNVNVDHAMSHLGKAQGIVTLLRSIPYTGRSKATIIPQETLIKHGISQERIIRQNSNDKAVEDCIFEIATMANQHLQKARELSETVPRSLRKILLPAVAVDRYLERLRKANFSLTHQSVLQRDSMLPMALYWKKLCSKF